MSNSPSKISSPFHVLLLADQHGQGMVSFDDALERLAQIPGNHIELDGSFAWRPSAQTQIDGMIYDAYGCIQHIDLKATCDSDSWRAVVDAVSSGAPEMLTVQVLSVDHRPVKNLHEFEKATFLSGQ